MDGCIYVLYCTGLQIMHLHLICILVGGNAGSSATSKNKRVCPNLEQAGRGIDLNRA
jgi:hypothetical protein